MRAEDLQHTTFAPHVGDEFVVVAGDRSVTVVLVEVSELRSSASADSFTLLFRGPGAHALPQGEHRYTHAQLGEFPLFIVPVGPVGDEMQYEAVFNRRRPPV